MAEKTQDKKLAKNSEAKKSSSGADTTIDNFESKVEVKQSKNNANQIKTQAHLSKDDFFRAHIAVFYRRPTTILIYVLAAVILVDIYFRYNFMRESTSTFFWVVSVASLMMATIGLPFVLKLQIRRLFNFNEYWYAHPKFCVDNKGISVTTQKGGVRSKWEDFQVIRENKEFFLFQINRFNIIVLPFRALTKEDRLAVRNLVFKNTEGTDVKVKIKATE